MLQTCPLLLAIESDRVHGAMLLRRQPRQRDGELHRHWSILKSRRVVGGSRPKDRVGYRGCILAGNPGVSLCVQEVTQVVPRGRLGRLTEAGDFAAWCLGSDGGAGDGMRVAP